MERDEFTEHLDELIQRFVVSRHDLRNASSIFDIYSAKLLRQYYETDKLPNLKDLRGEYGEYDTGGHA